MAEIRLPIDDAKLPRICAAHGVADAAGLKVYLLTQMKAKTLDYEAEQAAQQAKIAARQKAESEL